jgi:PAS domain S-box-containing protein
MQEHRYRLLAESVADVIWTADIDLRFTYVSPSVVRMLGYTPEELLGWPVKEVLTQHSFATASMVFQKEMQAVTPGEGAGCRVQTMELEVKHKSGSTIWIEASMSLLYNENRPVEVVGVARDVTQRLRTEAALRESEERFRRMADNIRDGLTIVEQGKVIYANDRACEIFGCPRDEYIHLTSFDFAAPEEEERLQAAQREARRTGAMPTELEFWIVRPDGTRRYIQNRYSLMYEDGEATGRYIVTADITERKRTEEALRHYIDRLKTLRTIDQAILAAASPESTAQATLSHVRHLVPCRQASVALIDREGSEVFVLAAHVEGETCLGKGKRIPIDSFQALSELEQGRHYLVEDTHVLTGPIPTDKQLLAEGVRSFLKVPLMFRGELIGSLNLGSSRPDAFTYEHVEIARELADQLAVAIQNARLQRQVRYHAHELAVALARSQELERLKSEFIQNVSHELRSPLSLIRGYAELLDAGELGKLSPEQQGPVHIITRRARMLGELVEDITLILGAEARPLSHTAVALDQLARAAAEDFSVAAEQADLELRTEIEAHVPPVGGEAVYLRRLLDNLLGNAVKFTPSGGRIVVRVYQEGERVVLEVSDTGIGISPEQQERIFDRFYQVNGSARRRYSGVGLGLALVRDVVNALNGEIELQSQVDKGSTFTVRLPVYREDDS